MARDVMTMRGGCDQQVDDLVGVALSVVWVHRLVRCATCWTEGSGIGR